MRERDTKVTEIMKCDLCGIDHKAAAEKGSRICTYPTYKLDADICDMCYENLSDTKKAHMDEIVGTCDSVGALRMLLNETWTDKWVVIYDGKEDRPFKLIYESLEDALRGIEETYPGLSEDSWIAGILHDNKWHTVRVKVAASIIAMG